MKTLLEEAGKMLKGMSNGGSPEAMKTQVKRGSGAYRDSSMNSKGREQ